MPAFAWHSCTHLSMLQRTGATRRPHLSPEIYCDLAVLFLDLLSGFQRANRELPDLSTSSSGACNHFFVSPPMLRPAPSWQLALRPGLQLHLYPLACALGTGSH